MRTRRSPLRSTAAPAAVIVACVAACAIGACASTSAAAAEAIRDPAAGSLVTTRIETTQGATEVRSVNSTTTGLETPVAADADKVFAVLPAVYEGLGLTINTVVSDARTLGLREARAPRRLGKEPLSRYLECGADATGASHADGYAVTLTVLSRVTASGAAASAVVTQVLASARPMSTSGNAVRCMSNGRLEQAINDAAAGLARR